MRTRLKCRTYRTDDDIGICLAELEQEKNNKPLVLQIKACDKNEQFASKTQYNKQTYIFTNILSSDTNLDIIPDIRISREMRTDT